MKNLTIFSGITFGAKLTFSVDKEGCLSFSSDVEPDEIDERIDCQIKASDFGCQEDTIDIFRKARNKYLIKYKRSL